MKKFYIFLIGLILLFSLYLIINLIPKNYTYKYKYKDFTIVEKYDKKAKSYIFEITKDDISFIKSLESKYYTKRGLITNVKLESNCLNVTLKKLDDFQMCKKDEKYYTVYYDDTYEKSKKKDSYEKVDIYDLNNKTYLIWNYNYFIGLNARDKAKITLFNNDFYTLDVISKYDGKLVVADYNDKYTFTNLYIVNPKKMNYEKLELDRKIYFNSYFLGEYKKYLYLYDLQKKQEYKINMKDGTVTKNKAEILIDGKFVETSINKLNKKDLYFKDNNSYYFILEDKNLIYKTISNEIYVTNMPVDRLVYENNHEAYFLCGDTLYYVHIDKGITKLLSYSEWIFNNMGIYIF